MFPQGGAGPMARHREQWWWWLRGGGRVGTRGRKGCGEHGQVVPTTVVLASFVWSQSAIIEHVPDHSSTARICRLELYQQSL